MNLQNDTKELLDSGMTEKELATEAGCDTSTINRIKRGETVNPRLEVAFAIQRLHEAQCSGLSHAG